MHSIKEEHLDDICAQCKNPHGNKVTIKRYNNKTYEIIICEHCGYEIIRLEHPRFTNMPDTAHLM